VKGLGGRAEKHQDCKKIDERIPKTGKGCLEPNLANPRSGDTVDWTHVYWVKARKYTGVGTINAREGRKGMVEKCYDRE